MLIDQVMNLFNAAITAVVSWFSSVMDSTGAGELYVAMMSVVLSVSLLLGPLMGHLRSGLSDSVHRPRGSGRSSGGSDRKDKGDS